MASLRRIFNTTIHKINAIGGLLGPLSRIFQILKKDGVTGLVFHIKDRLGARVRLLIIIFLIILPPVLVLVFIKTYAVNVSVWDDLTFVPLFDKVYTGDLSLADLFAQHNEHRIFFPRLAMLALGVITHHNTVVESYFSWFLLCLIGCVFFLFHIRTFGTGKTALATFIPIVWLIFNLQQSQNILWGFQIQFFMLILFFLLAIYLLTTSKGLRWRFALAVASGVVCTFSMANGLLVWPIGLILILWIRQSQPEELRRSYLRMAYIWCLVGIVVFISYFIDYHDPQRQFKMEYFIQHPLSDLAYFLASIGSLTYYEGVAIGTGLILLFLYTYTGGTIVWQTKARLSIALSLSLILFALLSIVLMTFGRSFLGVEDALGSRHITIGTLGIVGLYLGMISLETKYVNVKTFLLGFLTLFIILGIGLSYGSGLWGSGIKSGPSWRDFHNLNAYYLSTYRVQSDENLGSLYPWDPQVAREGAEVLEKHRLNVFARPSLEPEELTPAEGSTLFHIDSINDRPPSQQDSWIINVSQQEETLTIVGWAVDQQVQNTAGGVFVNIDGQIDIPALYGLDRPDVATLLGENRYRYSGFWASFATSVVGEGQHTLSLKIVTADKKGYYEADQKIILEVR